MRSKDIRRMLSESRELTPSAELKNRVLDEALPPQNAAVPPSPSRVSAFWHTRRAATLMTALLICVILIGGGFGVYGIETESVYLDVNPSVELALNLFGRVINVQYMNEDAEQSLSEAKLKQMSVEDAVDTILTVWGEQGYLEDAELNITVVAKDSQKSDQLLSKLEEKAEKCKSDNGYSMEIQGNRASREDRDAAKESGLSPAKYQLIREILQRDGSYTESQLSAMTMKELRELCQALGADSKGQPDRDPRNEEKKDKDAADPSAADKPDAAPSAAEKNGVSKDGAGKDAAEKEKNPNAPDPNDKNEKQNSRKDGEND